MEYQWKVYNYGNYYKLEKNRINSKKLEKNRLSEFLYKIIYCGKLFEARESKIRRFNFLLI